MEFRAFFKHMATSPALHDYAERKLGHSIETYVHRPTAVQVTFAVEGGLNLARCHVTGGGGLSVQVEAADATSMYSCVDRLQAKLEERLRRRKEKLVDHKVRGDLPLGEEPQEGALAAGTEGDEDALDASYVINFEKARDRLGHQV